ncbi:TOX high mobility group box family member 4-B [Aplochiton taeniatus]
MDLNFYSDLSDGSGQNVDSEFLNTQAYNGYSGNKFSGGSDNYLNITGAGHPFLSAEQTFHTPSLGDEVFEIPPISLDPDPALSVGDVVSHFGLSDSSEGAGGPSVGGGLARNPVVGANDPSFASTYVTPGSQGLEHLSLAVMNQAGGGALLSSTLGAELGHSIGSHFSSSSPMTIDVPLSDINHGLLGHNPLTTIDQSELNAHLGLGLGGGTILSHKSSEQPLSATPSPAGSLQDEDMDDFRSVLADSPMSLSVSPAVLSHMPSLGPSTSMSSATVKKGGGKPATLAITAGPGWGKKGRKKKDPNEPQKPVSAYALFFRDTQAAIKGQNPSATFGEVSKIVASMWDSLGEEQKQVYKRKTEAAKKEYLKALAAYRANQLSQTSSEAMEVAPSPPRPVVTTVPIAPPSTASPIMNQQARFGQYNPDENTITNICTSNIILDVPQVSTRSRTGAVKPTPTPVPTTAPAQTVTKIIISKQMLQAGGQIPTSLLTVLPAGVRALQPAAAAALSSVASRQPPPLQQMQHALPPPRLQQMVHSPAPPPLQAKPRGGGGGGGGGPGGPGTATAPPPLQIKIVPSSLQGNTAVPLVVSTASTANLLSVALSSAAPTSAYSAPTVAVQVVNSSDSSGNAEEEVVAEEFSSGEVAMELSVCPSLTMAPAPLTVCVRAGCCNPAVESKDWDKEYCSNECVATHCRDIFMAWCSIRNQNTMAVK